MDAAHEDLDGAHAEAKREAAAKDEVEILWVPLGEGGLDVRSGGGGGGGGSGVVVREGGAGAEAGRASRGSERQEAGVSHRERGDWHEPEEEGGLEAEPDPPAQLPRDRLRAARERDAQRCSAKAMVRGGRGQRGGGRRGGDAPACRAEGR